MALITCPECGRRFSDYAPHCPDCYIPTEIIKKLFAEAAQNESAAEQHVEAAREIQGQVDQEQRPAIRTGKVRCIICEKEYDLADFCCPACKFPALSLSARPDNQMRNVLAEFSEKITSGTVQLEIGNRFYYGKGIKRNYEKAFEWYRKASDNNNKEAPFLVGYMYENGIGVKQNYQKAVKSYRKAAMYGDSRAELNLGNMYEKGLGFSKNLPKAIEWYKKAAEHGSEDAKKLLANTRRPR